MPRKSVTTPAATKKKRRRDTWCGWAYGLPVDYGVGIKIAREIVERMNGGGDDNRSERRADALAKTAALFGLTPSLAELKMKQSREEFYPGLSESGIRYQQAAQRRARARRLKGGRSCAEVNCSSTIPGDAHANRRFCDVHRNGAARVRRHRSSDPEGA